MLRTAATLAMTSAVAAAGCVFPEPVQQAPAPPNVDSAPVIVTALPGSHRLSVTPSVTPPFCTLEAGLPRVVYPRSGTLTARFFFNAGDLNAASNPVSIGGQSDFVLQPQASAHTYSLQPQVIPLDDILSPQLQNAPNVLWVYVSDDFDQCPTPSSPGLTSSNPSAETVSLPCYTVAWPWVIDLTGCPLLAQ